MKNHNRNGNYRSAIQSEMESLILSEGIFGEFDNNTNTSKPDMASIVNTTKTQ